MKTPWGAGDAGVACQSQEADDQVAADRQGVGAGAGPGLVKVFAEGDVADPVEAVSIPQWSRSQWASSRGWAWAALKVQMA